MNIYVGNLPYKIRDKQLMGLFQSYGEVSSARVIIEKESGRSKGFGFVEMPNDEEANSAIKELNGSLVEGRNIVVNESTVERSFGRGEQRRI
ncbi:MAG: RNA recognition motif domain-containing protein [Bacteroidales bacterium]|jgi:RNA recognition motif-containing protein|nr:RNA-binding protein [Bacteroidota bacterium]